MFKRHSEKKGNAGASEAGGADAAQLARYKNQAAKARDKIVELVKERDKAQKDAEEQRCWKRHRKRTTPVKTPGKKDAGKRHPK